MTTTITMPRLADVIDTYCGLTGCACGCGGDYVAPTHAPSIPSYRVVNDGTVMRRLNRLLKADPQEIRTIDGIEGLIFEYVYGKENPYGEGRVIRIYTDIPNKEAT